MKAAMLLCVLSSSLSACAEPLTVDEVLAKVREGTGRAHLPAAGVRMTGTTEFLGLPEDCTLTMTGSGSFILEQSGKVPFTRAVGAKGPWMVDIGGEVRRLFLGDAEEARLLAAACTGCWMDSPACVPLDLSVDAAKGNENRLHLAFTLRDGVTHGDISIDTHTWRPAEWTMQAGSRTEVLTFIGDLMVDGAWLPRQIVEVGQEGATSTYTFTAATPAPAFFRSPYEPASLTPRDITFDPAVPAALESRRAKTGHALVKVLVDGKLGWFIFDTGAGGTVIDAAFADQVGLTPFGSVQAVGVGGAVTTTFVRPKAFTVGPATQAEALLTRLDLSRIAKAMGEKIDGVVGYNIMHRTIARLSTADGSVSLHDPAKFDDHGIRWYPLIVYDRHACLEASFEDHTGVFKLDTGAGTQPVSMHFPAVERFKLLEGRPLKDASAGGVGGNVKMKSGTLAWLEIGGRREENVPATFAIEPKGLFANPFTLGNLSLKQVGPRDLVFDYAGGRIAFPDRATAAPAK